jgi:uncharacterized membrane protein YgdD (TMEM256/DUF423 family)
MNWTAVAAIFLALAVCIGAFGAHLLQGTLDAYSMNIWERSVMYHFFHALGLLAVPALARVGLVSVRGAEWTCRLLAAGIVLFSGSLYVFAITGVRALGAITPLGGVCFIAAWVVLAAAARARVILRAEKEGDARIASSTSAGTDAASHPAVPSGVR